MSLLGSTRDAFADRNVPLYLLLGMVSLARRLDGVLAKKRGRERRPEPEPHGEDALVYLILGLISARKTLLSELEPIRAAHRSRDHGAPEPPCPSPLPSDLLR